MGHPSDFSVTVSEIVRVTREIYHVKGSFTASYRPNCNGACEAMNKYLTTFLSFQVASDQKDRDTQVPVALYYYNNAPSDRKTAYTPFYLLYGRHGRSSLSFKLPSVNVPTHVQDYVTDLVNKLAEAHDVAKENTRVHQEKMKEYCDNKSTLTKLKEGEKCFFT